MKIKVSEATNTRINWLVAHCVGYLPTTKITCIKCEGSGEIIKYGYSVMETRNCSECGGNGEVALSETDGIPYTTDWGVGGTIIDSEDFMLDSTTTRAPHVKCRAVLQSKVPNKWGMFEMVDQYGPTALIAYMRCFVAVHLGNDVDIPEEFRV